MNLRITQNPLSDHFVPYYHQIANLIRRKIWEGEFPPGAKFPNEVELADIFGVSRAPVRRALALLEADGFLTRQRGRGTFVADSPPPLRFPVLIGLIEDYVTTGIQGMLALLSSERVPASRATAEFFRISGGDDIALIRRLRILDGIPYSYIMNCLPVAVAERISKEDLNSKTMVEIFEKRLGFPVREVRQVIEARTADSEIAAQLSTGTASPVMYVETFVQSREGIPLGFSRTCHRGDRYKYMVELTLQA